MFRGSCINVIMCYESIGWMVKPGTTWLDAYPRPLFWKATIFYFSDEFLVSCHCWTILISLTPLLMWSDLCTVYNFCFYIIKGPAFISEVFCNICLLISAYMWVVTGIKTFPELYLLFFLMTSVVASLNTSSVFKLGNSNIPVLNTVITASNWEWT